MGIEHWVLGLRVLGLRVLVLCWSKRVLVLGSWSLGLGLRVLGFRVLVEGSWLRVFGKGSRT